MRAEDAACVTQHEHHASHSIAGAGGSQTGRHTVNICSWLLFAKTPHSTSQYSHLLVGQTLVIVAHVSL